MADLTLKLEHVETISHSCETMRGVASILMGLALLAEEGGDQIKPEALLMCGRLLGSEADELQEVARYVG